MSQNFIVEGDLNADVDSSSSSESESDEDREPEEERAESQTRAARYNVDSDEEEIEVFTNGHSSASAPKESLHAQHSSANIEAETQQKTEPAAINANSDNDTFELAIDQEFGVSYQKTVSVTEEMKALLEENERLQMEELTRLNERHMASAADDDEFAFDDNDANDNNQAIQLAIAGIKIEENVEIDFKDVVPVINPSVITSSQNDSFQFGAIPSIDEPLIMNQKDDPTKVDARKALNDIVDVYANGMGDQEVLMLDMKDKQTEKELNSKIVIDKTLGAIAEDEDEEEDDDAPNNASRSHLDKEEFVRAADAVDAVVDPVQSEWDEVEKNAHRCGNKADVDSRSADVKMTFAKATQYIKTLDLSMYEDNIVTNESSSKSWLNVFGGSAKLEVPNSEKELKFPFLVAQVDYDPNNIDHLSMLKSIYAFLVNSDQAQVLQPMDKNWEKLGFQGRDPRTDLNRSMKLLSVLQVLAFIQSHPTTVKFLFDLSESVNNEVVRVRGEFDKSWPFMCVAVLITKESIQALRSGALNEVCNRHRDVMKGINEFHHACFSEFGRLLLKEPTKHHAEQLATLRDRCAKNPQQILKNYQIGKLQKQATKQDTQIAMESLSSLETMEEADTSAVEEKGKKGMFTGLFSNNKKASKFAV